MKKIIILFLILSNLSCSFKLPNINQINIETNEGINKAKISWELPEKKNIEFVEIGYKIKDSNNKYEFLKVNNKNKITINDLKFDKQYIFIFTTHYKNNRKSESYEKELESISRGKHPEKIKVIKYDYLDDAIAFDVEQLDKKIKEITINLNDNIKGKYLFEGKKEITNNKIILYGLDVSSISTITFTTKSYAGKKNTLRIKNKFWISEFDRKFSDLILNKDKDIFNNRLKENKIFELSYSIHPLTKAIKLRDWDLISFLLTTELIHNHSFDMGPTDIYTYLGKAISENDIKMGTFLIKNGYKYTSNSYDSSLMSDFTLAVYYGAYEIVKLMLESGANPNMLTGGRNAYEPGMKYTTLLKIAEKNNHTNVYDLLLEFGADNLIPSSNYLLVYTKDNKLDEKICYLSRNRNKDIITIENDINLKFEDAIKYKPRIIAIPDQKTLVFNNRDLKGEAFDTIYDEKVAIMYINQKSSIDENITIYFISEKGKRGWAKGVDFTIEK